MVLPPSWIPHCMTTWEIFVFSCRRMIITFNNMAFALSRCHLASRRFSHLKKRTAAWLPGQRIIIIKIATILTWAIVKCKAALIGGGADGTSRSHNE